MSDDMKDNVESLVRKMRDPKFCDSLVHLCEYTGLDEVSACRRIAMAGKASRREYVEFDPRTPEEHDTFYKTCKWYLFLNVYRLPMEGVLDRTVPGDRVLDFGAGCGNDVLWLARHKRCCDYCDINVLQYDFFYWRLYHATRNENLPASIMNPTTILKGGKGSYSYDGEYDAIIVRDVLEHMPGWKRRLRMILRWLKQGGVLLEHTPWNNEHMNNPMHGDCNREDFVRSLQLIGLSNIGKEAWRYEP